MNLNEFKKYLELSFFVTAISDIEVSFIAALEAFCRTIKFTNDWWFTISIIDVSLNFRMSNRTITYEVSNVVRQAQSKSF